MPVRPYTLLGASTLRQVEHLLATAVSSWQLDWGLQNIEASFTCQRAWEAERQADKGTRVCYRQEGKTIWLSWAVDLPKHFQRLLFPAELSHMLQGTDQTSIAYEGAKTALGQLTEALIRPFGLGPTHETLQMPESPLQRGSGAVAATVRIGEQTLHLLVNRACIETMLPPHRLTPLNKVDFGKAVGTAPVSLQVVVGEVELGLGALLALAIGDVVRLPTKIDQPLRILGPGQRPLFGGHLGSSAGSLAIEAIRVSQ